MSPYRLITAQSLVRILPSALGVGIVAFVFTNGIVLLRMDCTSHILEMTRLPTGSDILFARGFGVSYAGFPLLAQATRITAEPGTEVPPIPMSPDRLWYPTLPETDRDNYAWECHYGWPFAFASCWSDYSGRVRMGAVLSKPRTAPVYAVVPGSSDNSMRTSIIVNGPRYVLPMRIDLMRLLASLSSVLIVAWLVLTSGRCIRVWHRTRMGRCAVCAHVVRGLSRCPECGALC